MKKKNKKYAYIILAIVAVVAVIGFAGQSGSNDTISAHFYDKNGNEVKMNPMASVVSSGSSSIEGVYSMNFVVNVKNTGDIALTASLGSASPSQLDSALPNTLLTVNPGETKSWTSTMIDTAQFDGTTQTFSVGITGSYTYAGQTKTLAKQGSLSYSFAADPVAGLDVSLGSSVGDSSIGTTSSNLLTSGTTCTANSECQSNSCISQTYDCSYQDCQDITSQTPVYTTWYYVAGSNCGYSYQCNNPSYSMMRNDGLHCYSPALGVSFSNVCNYFAVGGQDITSYTTTVTQQCTTVAQTCTASNMVCA